MSSSPDVSRVEDVKPTQASTSNSSDKVPYQPPTTLVPRTPAKPKSQESILAKEGNCRLPSQCDTINKTSIQILAHRRRHLYDHIAPWAKQNQKPWARLYVRRVEGVFSYSLRVTRRWRRPSHPLLQTARPRRGPGSGFMAHYLGEIGERSSKRMRRPN